MPRAVSCGGYRKARVEMVSNVNTKWSAGQRSPYLLAVQATHSVHSKEATLSNNNAGG